MYQAGKDILNAYERVSTGDMMAMRQPCPQRAREVRGTGAGVRRQAVRRADPGLGSDAGPNQINPQGNDDDRLHLILDVSAERLQEVLQSAGYRVTVSEQNGMVQLLSASQGVGFAARMGNQRCRKASSWTTR